MALFSFTLRRLESSLISIVKPQAFFTLCQNRLQTYSALAPTKLSRWRIFSSRPAKVLYICTGSGLVVYNTEITNYFSTSTPDIITKNVSFYILDRAPPEPKKLATSYKNPNDNSGLKITLYQYMTCPFCCKVRAFLDFYGFSYDIVEVNSVTREQTKWTKYRKVPFLVVREDSTGMVYQLKDSSLIISSLVSYLSDTKTNLKQVLESYPVTEEENENGKKKEEIRNKYALMYPQFPKDRNREEIMKEREWRKWVDDQYVHMLSPNVYRTFSEAKQAFSWFAEAGNWKELFPKWELILVHYVGSTVMYLIAKRLKKRHHLRDDVRIELYDSSNLWLNAIKRKQTKFMGGDDANLSDISVYGVLTAIEGCDAFNDLLNNTKINSWYKDMKHATNNKLGSYHVEQSRL